MPNLNREYQVVVIASPEMTEEALSKLQGQVGELCARHQGRIVETVPLGRRKLSYKIGRFTEGACFQMKLELPPVHVGAFQKGLKPIESILRSMVVEDDGSLGTVGTLTEETPQKSEVKDGQSQ